MRKVAVTLSFATLATVNSAWAADYPEAYDSTYESTIQGVGTQQIHYMSDGKGHMRTETTDSKGETSIVLMDYPQHTLISTLNINGQKRFMKAPLPDYQPGPWKQGSKELGAKVIDDHPCHGYEKTYPNGQTSQIWVDDNTNATVLTETVGSDPKITSKMKTYVNKAPSFSMDLPGDYKPYP